MIEQISSKEFHTSTQQGGVVIVDYFATWCMPCQMMANVIENTATIFPNIKFVKINIDDETELAIKQKIEAVPTIVAYKNGEEINRILGYRSQEEFRAFLNSLV